jgi:hypothetical protein
LDWLRDYAAANPKATSAATLVDTLLASSESLRVELLALCHFGYPFKRATAFLESDDLLVDQVYDVVQTLTTFANSRFSCLK